MKIAVDAQLLLDEEKTGIAWFAEKTIEELHRRNYAIEYNFFCTKQVEGWIAKDINCKILQDHDTVNVCKFMDKSLFRFFSIFLPIPYAKIMGSEADSSIFFNYIIPFGVKGKKISMVHDMAYKAYPKTVTFKNWLWLTLALPQACKRADYILTPSQFSKQEIIKYHHVPEEKIKVISCGVDNSIYHIYAKEKIEEIKRKYKISGEYYLYVGTLEPRKNLERVILAYSRIITKKKGVPGLVLAGKKGWMYRNIFKLIRRLQLEKKVIITGYLPKEDIPVLMSGAKIFLYPSLYEGFGMPPLEAMACRTAVLSSNAASLPEVVGDAGVLVNPCSVQDICKGMLYLETNHTVRMALAEKGYERSRQFTWERVGENISKIL